VAIGPRWPTGAGHAKAEAFLRDHFRHDQLEEDSFTANTPIGPVAMRNFIVRFPARRTACSCWPLTTRPTTGSRTFITWAPTTAARQPASWWPSPTGCANRRRAAGKLDGYSVWLVFFDGEEAIQSWTETDSTYGSRHLAAKWGGDGTLAKIKAFILTDMIGDKNLDIQRESQSTGWLVDLVGQAAKKFGDERYFFKQTEAIEDDHLPFVQRGVPSIDIIDMDYGPNDSYHHTAQDTMDKLSAKSLMIDGDVILEAIRLIDQR